MGWGLTAANHRHHRHTAYSQQTCVCARLRTSHYSSHARHGHARAESVLQQSHARTHGIFFHCNCDHRTTNNHTPPPSWQPSYRHILRRSFVRLHHHHRRRCRHAVDQTVCSVLVSVSSLQTFQRQTTNYTFSLKELLIVLVQVLVKFGRRCCRWL